MLTTRIRHCYKTHRFCLCTDRTRKKSTDEARTIKNSSIFFPSSSKTLSFSDTTLKVPTKYSFPTVFKRLALCAKKLRGNVKTMAEFL